MPLGLTWLDVLLIIGLAMLLVQGHRRGLWVVLGNLVGLVGGAAIAFYALPEVAKVVTAPQWRWAALIATLVLLVAAGQYVGAAIGEAIRLRVNLPALRLVDRLLGALAAGLAGALVLWLVAFSIAASGSTAVTREVTRSRVITALDTVMPDSLLAWAARSRSAVADLDVLPELELPAPVPETDDGVRAAPAPAVTPGLPSAASSSSDTATSAPPATSAAATPEEPDAAAAASASTSAAPSATTTAPASSASTAAPSTPAASSASAAVVRLTGTAAQCNQVQSGSGVAVAPDRVLTNAHVVLGVDAPTVTDRARGVHAARIVHLDTAHDLAVLAVDDADLPVMPVGAELTGGASASVLGYPDGGPFASTPAAVQAVGEVPLGDVLTGAASMVDVYTLAADIRHGYSGGPVVDAAGNLAGLVFARARARTPSATP
ncbi:MarP family serine protease [Micrococcus luteus]|uniref:MarP family serine protease n=1 Tax=Micrococcus luteus TaxID=1270 RepID=UPI0028910461|nr:MarP family serine protease [Micrococcus luteus]MDT1990130.1 MarP family serine protease [Micrococcus luteus]